MTYLLQLQNEPYKKCCKLDFESNTKYACLHPPSVFSIFHPKEKKEYVAQTTNKKV